MSNQRYLDELEDFLAQEADSHRMYPSDRVWLNIAKKVQPDIKWPALTFSAILLGALYILGILFVHPDKDLWTPDMPKQLSNKQPVQDRLSKAVHMAATPASKLAFSPSGFQNPAVLNAGGDRLASTDPGGDKEAMMLASDNKDAGYVGHSGIMHISPNTSLLAQPALLGKKGFEIPVVKITAGGQLVSANDDQNNSLREQATENAHQPMMDITEHTTNTTAPNTRPANAQLMTADKGNPNISLSVGAPLPVPEAGRPRWDIRFYATPSISYRMLFDNKGSDFHYANSSLRGPVAPNWVNNVSAFVRHKPLIGLEAGSAVSYALTRNLKLRAGLQLNYRQYQTEAFRGPADKATILLERNGGVDTMTSISTMVNQTGKFDINLTNRWAELAVPVGFDVEVASGKIGKFYISGTVQPTYTFYSNGFLLSTDFSRYVDRQDLFRKFNLNSSLEAYLEVPGKAFNWQIGPQIRYQMLPGTVPGYNVRQHLIDYGLKVGVMKNLR